MTTDDELRKLGQTLNVKQMLRLVGYWTAENTKNIKYTEGQEFLNVFMRLCLLGKQNEIDKWIEHASAAESAGAEALMRCKNQDVLHRAKFHVDKFKGRSFNNYENWFYNLLIRRPANHQGSNHVKNAMPT